MKKRTYEIVEQTDTVIPDLTAPAPKKLELDDKERNNLAYKAGQKHGHLGRPKPQATDRIFVTKYDTPELMALYWKGYDIGIKRYCANHGRPLVENTTNNTSPNAEIQNVDMLKIALAQAAGLKHRQLNKPKPTTERWYLNRYNTPALREAYLQGYEGTHQSNQNSENNGVKERSEQAQSSHQSTLSGPNVQAQIPAPTVISQMNDEQRNDEQRNDVQRNDEQRNDEQRDDDIQDIFSGLVAQPLALDHLQCTSTVDLPPLFDLDDIFKSAALPVTFKFRQPGEAQIMPSSSNEFNPTALMSSI